MSVYVDPTISYPGKGPWCHMAADSLDELHEMASKIGLKREWFQARARFPHYDLRPSKRYLAIRNGAVEISAFDLLRKLKEKEGS